MPKATVRPNGSRVFHLRAELALTQEELAQKAGYNKRTIERIEKSQATKMTTLCDVASVLGVDAKDLIDDNERDPTDTTKTENEVYEEIELVIDGDFDSFTVEEEQRFVRVLKELCGITDRVVITRRRRGSIILRLRMSKTDRDRVHKAAESGLLSPLNVVGFNEISDDADIGSVVGDVDTESPISAEPSLTMQADQLGLSRSDRSLLVLVRGGEEEAAKALYERYAHRLFGLVERKLGEKLRAHTDTEDIVQSVFMSIFRGVKSGLYDAPAGSTLWNLLAVIAVHKLRSRAQHLTAQRRDVERNVPLEYEIDQIPSDESSIELLEICLRESLESLRPVDRCFLSLRIQGHTVDEISKTTGRSRRTVERSLQKSRERLAGLLLDDNERKCQGD